MCRVSQPVYPQPLQSNLKNLIFHFRLSRSTPKYSECVTKKRYTLDQIESKLDTGLDRAINAIVGWVRTYLQSEQRKTDFKPESDFDTVASAACQHVVQQMIAIIKQIQRYLDGENSKRVMSEIGVRLHRIIYEHLQQFQYTTAGEYSYILSGKRFKVEINSF